MKQYSSLIVAAIRARRKKLKPGQPGFVYYEWHHVWPVAFGKDDRPQNLVLLTFPEHVEAHVLLAKLYPKAHKIQNVAARMLTGKRGELVSVKAAAEARKLASAATTERNNRLHAEGLHPFANQGSSHPSKKPENRAAKSERAKEQVQCPHCDKTGGWGGMLKSHFDHCLQHLDNIGLTRKQIKTRRNYERCRREAT